MDHKERRASISRFIIANISAIIKDWEMSVRSHIKNSESETSAILINHLPELIVHIAEAVASQEIHPRKSLNRNSAKEHAKERAFKTSFSLSELIEEYTILRDIILSYINKEAPGDLYLIRILQQFVDDAIMSAVLEFTQIKERDTEAAYLQLREFFMETPIAFAILKGADHCFEFANPLYEKLVKRKVVGRKIMDVFTYEEVSFFKELLDKVYQSGESFTGNEASVHMITKEETTEEIWINYGLHPSRDSEGNVVGVMAVIIDVTELVMSRKKIEKSHALFAMEQFKLNAIFEKSPAGMVVWRGKDLVYERINPKYQSFFVGRDLLNRKLVDALPEFKGKGFEKLLVRVLETGVGFTAHEALSQVRKKPDGPLEDIYFDFTCVQITDYEGNPYGVFGHAMDVTERVLANRLFEENRKKLQNYVSLLESEKELRERFVAALSHDLRTPLSAAKMSAQVLIRKPDDSASIQKMSRRIADNMDRADNMIRDILDASRFKAGEKISLIKSECQLNTLVEKTIENLSTIHGERFIIKGKKQVVGCWDCQALQRVIENLVNNAVKYGSGTDLITIGLDVEDKNALLWVHNLGNPLSLEDQKYIFKPYKRLESAKSHRQKGWGIGLTLVSGFVQAHGGGVSVESSPEKGTTFIVSLPLIS